MAIVRRAKLLKFIIFLFGVCSRANHNSRSYTYQRRRQRWRSCLACGERARDSVHSSAMVQRERAAARNRKRERQRSHALTICWWWHCIIQSSANHRPVNTCCFHSPNEIYFAHSFRSFHLFDLVRSWIIFVCRSISFGVSFRCYFDVSVFALK